ncbi:uncharacterized protein [Anoplolepis gracilipes]|uniref:uncharacterized protein n=1 Tax=Anoplolepis gracilipes TaxID=354296 RepID=UPI003BA39FF6
MKQPIAVRIIKFPLKLIMANTCKIFANFAVIFLASLSLSSAFTQDFTQDGHFQENFDLKQPFIREKRGEDVYLVTKPDPLELEELSESQTVHNRRAIEEKQLNYKADRKNEEKPKTNDDTDDAKDDISLYKNMQDLIQAFILADEQDITMRLQQLRELQNATESETLSNLPKRSAAAAAAAAVASDLLGSNLWESVPLTDLDTYSCEDEAVGYGHVHVSGRLVHHLFCELRLLSHLFLNIVRSLRAGFALGPLITEEVIASGHGILHILLHPLRLLRTVIREPHHLLILPDIIKDAVPFRIVFRAFHRLVRVIFDIHHFIRELFWGHAHHVFGHFFNLHYGLRERLYALRQEKLHHLYGHHGYGSIIPYFGEQNVGGIGGDNGVSTATSAAAAAAAAAGAAAATATATAANGGVTYPDYRNSLAEILTSFRGFYNGYYASGMPHLIRTGVKSISTSTAYSKVISYLSNLPSYLSSCSNIGSYLSKIPSYLNNFSSYAPQSATVTATSTASASSSVSSPAIAPAIAPVAPIETVSSSASASASVAEIPVISAVPNIVSQVPIIPSTGAASAAATAAVSAAAAAAAASTVSASPIVSNYVQPCEPVFEPVSSVISETTVSESASNVASPGVVAPSLSIDNTPAVASASASASASSASNVSPVISAGPVQPLSLPYSLRYRPRPILSAAGPASAASASSSASVSSGGGLIQSSPYRGLDWNLGGRLPLNRPQVYPGLPFVRYPSARYPSSGAATAAASSAASGNAAAASSASSVSSGGLNFVLPRAQIIGALGHDYLTPGDIISITLRNKAILCGTVLDATSPISFNFLRPKLRASLLRNAGRVWNLSPGDFRDPECVHRLNSPRLLRYAN